MPNPTPYQDFTVQDFISDEYFQDWVLHPNQEISSFWDNWMEVHPDKRSVINEARLLLTHISFRQHIPPAAQAELALAKTWRQIDLGEAASHPGMLSRMRNVWKYAAIFILVILTGLAIYLSSDRQDSKRVSTQFGQLDSVQLPDQSEIVLNANSSIDFTDFKQENAREVWLNGEAFFNIKHLADDRPFLVHLGHATIKVLGTSFNIRKRRNMVEIALLTGSISLHVNNSRQPDIIMKPGELIVADTSFSRLTKTSTNTGNTKSWTEKRLVLNNPTVQEIINYLEDIYGKKIQLRPVALASKTVEGPILLDSLDDALFVLSTVLNVEIIKEGNTLVLQQR